MSADTQAEAPPRPLLWRRLLLITLGFAAVLLLLTAVLYLVNRGRMTGRLASTMKELDESDPDWRLDDLMRALPPVPPDEDSAPRILAIIRTLPKGWPDYKKQERLRQVDPPAVFIPPMVLGPDRRMLLDELLAAVPAQRLKARELIKYPRGRMPLVIDPNPIMTLMEDHQQTRNVAQLLAMDAWALALEGKPDEAIASSRACLNVSRAEEDSPFLVGKLIRVANAAVAMADLERTLALGEPSDAALAAAQKDLEREMASTGMVFAMRGERAAIHTVIGLIAERKFQMAMLEGMVRTSTSLPAERKGWVAQLLRLTESEADVARREHPAVLGLLTRMVKAAGLPTHEQIDAEQELMREVRASGGRLARAIVPSLDLVGRVGRRGQCAATAMHVLLAVERYRRKHGDFPADLNRLVPEYLPKVPLDPLDTSPIRYKRTADGVVVYSIGANRLDDGGKVADPSGGDVGYRLWDVKKRRQPAPALGPP